MGFKLISILLILGLVGCATSRKRAIPYAEGLEAQLSELEMQLAQRDEEIRLLEEELERLKEEASRYSYEIPPKPVAKNIQLALKKAGFYAGEIDGKIGKKTRKAIEDFQRANGLKVDGIVGAKTWERLKVYLE